MAEAGLAEFLEEPAVDGREVEEFGDGDWVNLKGATDFPEQCEGEVDASAFVFAVGVGPEAEGGGEGPAVGFMLKAELFEEAEVDDL